MFKLLSFLWSQYIQYLIFTGIIVFSVSCGFEDSAKSIADSNQTELLVKAPVLVPEVLDDVVLADFQNSQVLDLLFEKHISGIVPKITNSIPDPIHFNYERLENSFLKMLMQNNSKEVVKCTNLFVMKMKDGFIGVIWKPEKLSVLV